MNFLTKKARDLVPYVAGIQPNEPNWIKLNTNENPYPPSPKVVVAIKNFPLENLRLYPPSDSTGLQNAIANRYNVSPASIFCGNGSDEVLALAYQTFFSGKTVLTPDISYGFYPVWANMYDVNSQEIPVDENFKIGVSSYINAEGVILANPNAPTAQALSLAEVEQILQNNPSGVVLIDEAYIDFSTEKSAIPLTEKYENLLVVQTFSKSHALAGQRVGFAVGNPALIEGLQRMKNAFNSYPLDAISQTAAAAAISDIEYWDAMRKKVIATRENTRTALQKMGHKVLESHTNFILIKPAGPRFRTAQEWYEHLLANKILIRYWNKPRLHELLRVTIGTDREMEAFLQCMKQ